jgi:hypothetical protein
VDNFGGAIVPPPSVFLPAFSSPERGPGILYIGDSGLNFGTNSANIQRQFNLVNNFLPSAGSHALKFGVDYRRLTPVNRGAELTRALFFDTVADALAGNVSLFLAASAEVMQRPIYQNFSAYAQDAWRVSPRLTLTYGLRYEVNPAPDEQNGNLPYTVTEVDRPASLRLAAKGTRLYETTYDNVASRLGLAWRMLPRWNTTLRGGFGIFHDLGYVFSGSAISLGSFPYGNLVLDFAIPLNSPVINAPVPRVQIAPPYGDLIAYERGYQLPYTRHYNLTIEQPLGASHVVTISYVGAAGRRLGRVESLRDVTPDFPRIDVVRNAADSDYHALQAQFQRRSAHGLQSLVSYTWAKSLDTASDETTVNFLAPARNFDPRQDRGPSSFDLRHNFNAAISSDLPAPMTSGVGKALLGGFGLDTSARRRPSMS